jgi:glycerophosphoryl diester phosphodiesterase
MVPAAPRQLDFLTERPYAHRGLHGPNGPIENSFAAFDLAIEGRFGIELDVQLTIDKNIVVIHDAELPRLTNGSGRVCDHTAAELAALRLNGSNEPIRTLREAIQHIGGRVPVLIEAKSPGKRGVESMCRAIRRSIEGAAKWSAVMSFDPTIVRWFRKHSPHTVRGLVITEEDRARNRGVRGWMARSYGIRAGDPHFLAYDIRSLPARTATNFRRAGKPVLTWTVRGPEDRARAAEYADQTIFEQDAAAPDDRPRRRKRRT